MDIGQKFDVSFASQFRGSTRREKIDNVDRKTMINNVHGCAVANFSHPIAMDLMDMIIFLMSSGATEEKPMIICQYGNQSTSQIMYLADWLVPVLLYKKII